MSGSLLDGFIEVPFAWVAAAVGLVILAMLVYFARKVE